MKINYFYNKIYTIIINIHYYLIKKIICKCYKHKKKLKSFIEQLEIDPPKNIHSKEMAIFFIYNILKKDERILIGANYGRYKK